MDTLPGRKAMLWLFTHSRTPKEGEGWRQVAGRHGWSGGAWIGRCWPQSHSGCGWTRLLQLRTVGSARKEAVWLCSSAQAPPLGGPDVMRKCLSTGEGGGRM